MKTTTFNMEKIKPETRGYILRYNLYGQNIDVVYHPVWHGPIEDYLNSPGIQVIKFEDVNKETTK